jgi:hypothetical protein
MKTQHRVWKQSGMIFLLIVWLFVFSACQSTDPTTQNTTEATETTAVPMPETPSPDSASLAETPVPADETPAGSANQTSPYPADGQTDGTEQDSNGKGAYTITADTSEEGKSYTSEAADENALRVENGCTADVADATVEKTAGDASSSGDSLLCGLNAAVFVHDGAYLTLLDSIVRSDATGGGGAFASGSQANLVIENSTVRTTADHSGGLLASGGAVVTAENLSVSTQGASSAAVRSAGGGTVTVTGGTYTTSGTDSPTLVSTSDIAAQDATLRANHSAVIAIEDGGSVALTSCSVYGNAISANESPQPSCFTEAHPPKQAGNEAFFP